jgi:hypothetical protein
MRVLLTILITITLLGCDQSKEPTVVKRVPMETKSYSDLIEFKILPPVGSAEIEIEGNTSELLKNIPYLLSAGVIPSADIINEVLAKGRDDSGMSGGASWTPYQVDTNGFEELVTQLKAIEHYKSLEYIEPDSWVSNFEDWNVWVMYIKKGVPWKEHKRLNDIVVGLENQMEEAKASDDEQRVNVLHLKIIEAGTELYEFVMEHLQ